MVAFGFYIDKKLLNEGCGLRDAKSEVDMQILLESHLDSWNRFETIYNAPINVEPAGGGRGGGRA